MCLKYFNNGWEIQVYGNASSKGIRAFQFWFIIQCRNFPSLAFSIFHYPCHSTMDFEVEGRNPPAAQTSIFQLLHFFKHHEEDPYSCHVWREETIKRPTLFAQMTTRPQPTKTKQKSPVIFYECELRCSEAAAAARERVWPLLLPSFGFSEP